MSFAALRTVLLAEDDEAFRQALAERLRLAGLHVVEVAGGEAALRQVDASFAGVVVTDLRMPGMDGRQLTERIAALDPDLPVVVMTGHGDVAEAVSLMKGGAYDFLTKPFAPERLLETLGRALEKRALVLDNRRLAVLAETSWDTPLTGDSEAVRALRAAIAQLSDAPIDVLVEGETGSGKEAAARALHAAGRRRGRGFVPVACGALPAHGFETQLFGHEAGAFTGAMRRHAGQVEQSDGGTLFLDEVDQTPLPVQLALLRVLEEREVLPLGAREPRGLDLRIVAASKEPLDQAVAAGRVREDLYYRLNVVRLRVPPLRERREDVPLLFAGFLSRAAARLNRPPPAMTPAVRRRLLEHDWPGNLRELSNFAQQLVLGLEGRDDAPEAGQSLAHRVARYEAELIREALVQHRGDIPRVMAALGLPRKTLYDKLTRHGLEPQRFRQGRRHR